MSTPPSQRRGRLAWTSSRHLDVGRVRVALGDGIDPTPNAVAGTMQNAGIRPNTWLQRLAKEVVFRYRSRRGGVPWNRAVFHTKLGEYVGRYATADDVFLDVGAGAMQMEPFIPDGAWYNALDIAYSDFQLHRIRRRDGRFNVAMASITQIPLADDAVSVVIAAEMLQQVPPVTEALAELRRVLRPGGLLICSHANSHQPKYRTVGKNLNQAHVWGRADFERVLDAAGFVPVTYDPVGRWDPATNATLPEPPPDERDAAVFCYVARSTKA